MVVGVCMVEGGVCGCVCMVEGGVCVYGGGWCGVCGCVYGGEWCG